MCVIWRRLFLSKIFESLASHLLRELYTYWLQPGRKQKLNPIHSVVPATVWGNASKHYCFIHRISGILLLLHFSHDFPLDLRINMINWTISPDLSHYESISYCSKTLYGIVEIWFELLQIVLSMHVMFACFYLWTGVVIVYAPYAFVPDTNTSRSFIVHYIEYNWQLNMPMCNVHTMSFTLIFCIWGEQQWQQ